MDIKEFNQQQLDKANQYIQNILLNFKDLHAMLDDYKNRYTMLNEIVKKMNGDKIVSHSIRKTFFSLSRDLFFEFDNLLEKFCYPEHLVIYIKLSIGEYIEKDITELPSIDIFCKDEACFFDLEDKTFIIPQKIKTYIRKQYTDKMPDSFYKLHDKSGEKFMSTNNFAIFNIDKTVENINNMNEQILNIVASMEDVINANKLE